MDLQAEKIELIKLLLATERTSVINKVKEVFESEDNSESISQLQEKELEYRLKRYKKGESKFYSWDEVEEKLKSAF